MNKDEMIFCSHSCSASYNNVAYASKSYCLNCGAELLENRKFYSHDYQNEYNFKKWKEEYEINGNLEIKPQLEQISIKEN